MKKAKFYQEQRASKIEAQEQLLAKAKEENREFTADEAEKFDALHREIEDLNISVDRALKIEAAEARSAAAREKVDAKPAGESTESFNLLRYIQTARSGKEFTGAEKEVYDATMRAAEASGIEITGIPISMDILSRAISVGGNGANWVATENGPMIDALRDKLTMVSLGAQFLTGLEGDIQLPRLVGGTAVWEGETDANADSGADTEKVTMSPKRVGAITTLSQKFLKQTSPSTSAMFASDLVSAIAQAVNYAAINGTGGDQPTGILNTSGIGVVALGTNGAAPTWKSVVDLEKEVAVDNAAEGALNYLTNPQARAKMKTTAVDAGSGRMIWNFDNTVNGYPGSVSNGVPADLTKGSGTDLSAIIFGNFNDLVIGQWGVIDLIIDPYTKKNTAQVEIAANAYFDVAVRRPQSFAAIKDAITT